MTSQDSFDPHTFLTHIGAGRTIAAYRQHSPIFTQGDVADAVFYIQSGQVKLTVVSARGKEAVIAILGAQAFFGEGCLAGQPLRIATATALTDCALMRIEQAAMTHVLHAEPAFAALFTAYLLSRNSRIEEDLIDQLFNSSEKRLARVLLLLAHFGKEGKAEPVIPRISQETLAEMGYVRNTGLCPIRHKPVYAACQIMSTRVQTIVENPMSFNDLRHAQRSIYTA
jgi:CRP/FNR family transcriptional regulator, cyclic AMP receptor protein